MSGEMISTRWWFLGLGMLMLTACQREALWLDYPLGDGTGTAFSVQVEGVRDPVHGVVEQLAVAPSERVRVTYEGNPIASFVVTRASDVRAYWPTSSHLYAWFRFRHEDDNGNVFRREMIGRFDSHGSFQVCSDITPIQDRGMTLMFSGVVNDNTIRFARATGPDDTLEHIFVRISGCRTVDLAKWMKAERKAGGVLWPPLSNPSLLSR